MAFPPYSPIIWTFFETLLPVLTNHRGALIRVDQSQGWKSARTERQTDRVGDIMKASVLGTAALKRITQHNQK
jgi:hypothetical protein